MWDTQGSGGSLAGAARSFLGFIPARAGCPDQTINRNGRLPTAMCLLGDADQKMHLSANDWPTDVLPIFNRKAADEVAVPTTVPIGALRNGTQGHSAASTNEMQATIRAAFTDISVFRHRSSRDLWKNSPLSVFRLRFGVGRLGHFCLVPDTDSCTDSWLVDAASRARLGGAAFGRRGAADFWLPLRSSCDARRC